MARSIQSRKKTAKPTAQEPPKPDAVAPGFETSEEAVFHQLYDPGCTPLTPAEEESVWTEIDARMQEIRSCLAQFVFVLEEHERVVDRCRTPDDVTSLFVESRLPDAIRGQQPSVLPALLKWRSEIAAFRSELTGFYAGAQFRKKSAREAMWERSRELLGRFPVSTMKIMAWYHIVSSWCTTPESPVMDDLFSRHLMPDRALCMSVYQTMKAAFERMEQLRQRILFSHLRLVISIAKQSCNQPQQLTDIVQEGNIGLVKALDRFDSSLGHKFSTYATWWIRHEIMRALARQTRVIRIPQHMLATISRINRAEQAYVKRNGTEPTVEDLAAMLEMPKARIHAIRQMARQQISLQAPIRPNSISEDSDLTQEDRFGAPTDNDDFNPELHLSFQFLRDVVHRAVDNLPERDRKFVQMRFGLGGYEPMSIRQIAGEFHLTRERVRQIENNVFEKLRRSNPELASYWQDTLY